MNDRVDVCYLIFYFQADQRMVQGIDHVQEFDQGTPVNAEFFF